MSNNQSTPETKYENAWDARYFDIGQQHVNNPIMYFDWQRAASLIKEHNAKLAIAGLNGDFKHSSCVIYENKNIVDDNMRALYLSSTWAIPVVVLDGVMYECFTTEKNKSIWPKAARNLIER